MFFFLIFLKSAYDKVCTQIHYTTSFRSNIRFHPKQSMFLSNPSFLKKNIQDSRAKITFLQSDCISRLLLYSRRRIIIMKKRKVTADDNFINRTSVYRYFKISTRLDIMIRKWQGIQELFIVLYFPSFLCVLSQCQGRPLLGGLRHKIKNEPLSISTSVVQIYLLRYFINVWKLNK